MTLENFTIVLAHPDDEVIGCGGTLLKFTKIKSDISIVYITLGSNDKKKNELRKKEAHLQSLYHHIFDNKLFFWH